MDGDQEKLKKVKENYQAGGQYKKSEEKLDAGSSEQLGIHYLCPAVDANGCMMMMLTTRWFYLVAAIQLWLKH